MKITSRLGFLFAVFTMFACQDSSRLPEYELAGATMGTSFNVKVVAPPDELPMEALRQQIRDKLDSIEKLTSTYIKESELSMFNANPSTDWIDVSAELCIVVEQALNLSRETDGAFDITVGPLVNLWGFGAEGIANRPPTTDEIQSALSRVGYRRLQTRCDAPAMRKQQSDLYVDLSGWAKGYAVDELAALLDKRALSDYLIEIGGELRAQGLNAEGRKWAIAIEKPDPNGRDVQFVLRLTDMGVATSGDYRNFFEHEGVRYSHTIDTQSGWPVSHALAAVTVIDESAATADALATALLVLGPERGLAMADKLEIAGYFLLRGPAGVEAVTTPVFDRMYIL